MVGVRFPKQRRVCIDDKLACLSAALTRLRQRCQPEAMLDHVRGGSSVEIQAGPGTEQANSRSAGLGAVAEVMPFRKREQYCSHSIHGKFEPWLGIAV